MEWYDLFTEIILSRGYDYYLSDMITAMSISNQIIKATVAGYDNYEVEIKLSNNEVTSMYCSCPYASEGNNCKHMAAVLYKWHDSDIEEKEVVKNPLNFKNTDKFDKLIERASDNQIKQFLYTVLSSDEKLFLKFKALVDTDISSSDLKHYKREIDKTVNLFLGRDKFINYLQAPKFINAMESYLNEDVKMMIDSNCYWGAFELTSYLFLKVANVEMDDSNGELGMFSSECTMIWNEILSNVDSQLEDKMYRWFVEQLDGSLIDYMEETIEDILMKRFTTPKHLKEKLVFTQMKVDEAKKKDATWLVEFDISKWALRHLKIMEQLNYPSNEIDEYCKANWQSSSIRKYYIDKCINEQNYQQAIDMLKESLNIDKDYPGRVKEHSLKLKELYNQTNNQEAYKQQLWQIITKDDPGNLEIFKELKTLYPLEEWIKVREKIISLQPKYVRIDKLYLAEQMDEHLLEHVINERGLYALYEYEDVLKQKYTKQLLQKYYDELTYMASFCGDRKTYRQWVTILKRMQKLDGGVELVDELVENWKTTYKNRKAMMDELKKL